MPSRASVRWGTGDLGRYLPNDDVVFAGRADRQLKIRGFRIEPAEIEAVMTGHPTVREAVVVVRDKAGDRRLVAYLTVAESGEEMVPELRAELVRRLPGYMVPSAFVVLDRFPLTPTGKVDRAALPAPGKLRSADAGYVAPRTPVEERVAGIWRELLGVERIGVDDNFFEVGGHSLLVIRLLALLDAGPVPLDRTPEGEARSSEAIEQLAELHRFAEQIETRNQVIRLMEKLRDLKLLPPDVELPEDVEPDDIRAVRLFVARWRCRPGPYPGPRGCFDRFLS